MKGPHDRGGMSEERREQAPREGGGTEGGRFPLQLPGGLKPRRMKSGCKEQRLWSPAWVRPPPPPPQRGLCSYICKVRAKDRAWFLGLLGG